MSRDFLWNQFCKLGERIGDGDMDPDEEKWVNREYKKLSRHLIPEIKEDEKEQRKRRNKLRDQSISKYITENKCPGCSGNLKQSRSGSYVLLCISCNSRFKLKVKR